MVTHRLSVPALVFLDLLRVVLAQLIILGLAASFNGLFLMIVPPHFPWVQSVAVVGFFILSGFVITYSTLLKLELYKGYGFKDFFIERFSRIYTGLVPALLFVYVIDSFFIHFYAEQYKFYYSFDWLIALKNIFMLEKFPISGVGSPIFTSASTWWPIVIEWWIYMAIGWLVLYKKIHMKGIAYMCVLCFLLIVPIQYAFAGQSTIAIGITYVWMMGVLSVLLRQVYGKSCPSAIAKVCAFLFFILAGLRYQQSGNAYDLLAAMNLMVSFMFAIVYYDHQQSSFLLRFRHVINFMAGYSLTLYLTHYSVLWLLHVADVGSPYQTFVIGIVLSNLLALGIAIPTELRYHYLSKWLKSKFIYGKA